MLVRKQMPISVAPYGAGVNSNISISNHTDAAPLAASTVTPVAPAPAANASAAGVGAAPAGLTPASAGEACGASL